MIWRLALTLYYLPCGVWTAVREDAILTEIVTITVP